MNIRRLCIFVMVLLTTVVILVGTAGVGFGQDLAEYKLLIGLVEVPDQLVEIRSEDGDFVGMGTIRGSVTTEENGTAAGEVVLIVADQTGAGEPEHRLVGSWIIIDPIYARDQMVLSGMGRTEKDGEEQTFPAMVTLETETAVPPGCIWRGDVLFRVRDAGPRPVLPGGLSAEASGVRLLAWDFDNAWPSQVTGPQPKCDA